MLTALLAFCLGPLGCTRSDPQSDRGETAYAASGGIPPDSPDAQSNDIASNDIASEDAGTSPAQPQDSAAQGVPAASGDSSPIPAPTVNREGGPKVASGAAQGKPSASPATPFRMEGSGSADASVAKTGELALRADLSAEQLLEVLAGADQDMQLIVSGRSGIADPQKARDTLIKIVKMKLEASRRLSKHEEASAEAKSEGNRGELQSMSHLASLGDVKIAQELEKLANANLQSSDADLVADSRLVLIGFAIESLQNGKEEAADRIVDYVDQIAASEQEPDVPAMMVMGQARHTLSQYGHDDKARHVRGRIIELFADSPDAEIARMAASFAGNVQSDAIEELRGTVMDGGTVDAARWREALEALIRESADLQTVEYLAGAALEFESIGENELAALTYQVLADRFDDPESATGREVRLAIAAGQARRDVIGRKFDPDLPEIDGSALSMADYKGKVVLVPFWAMNFPESLQIISDLKAIAKAHGDRVAIVGMNLDVEQAPVQEFLQANDLGFPSFRAESSSTAKVANRVVAQFGMVSMPFTAIIDQQGRVAAINFSGRDLERTVGELVRR